MAEEKIYNKGDYTGADLIMEDGKFYIEDNGIRTAECVVKPYRGSEIIYLQPNSANRKFFMAPEARKQCEGGTRVKLLYKPSIKLGTVTRTNIPNAKLIEYLNEEDKAEYLAIIERAKQNYEAQKKKPMTEAEKLQAQIAKLQAKLNALESTDEEVSE